MSRPISPEQYEPSWNAAAIAEAAEREEAEARRGQYICPDCNGSGTHDTRDGRWLGICPTCEGNGGFEPDRTADGLLSILNGTVDTRRRPGGADITEHLAAKGEGTGMRGW